MQNTIPLLGRVRGLLSAALRRASWLEREPRVPPDKMGGRDRVVRVTVADDGERTVSWEVDTESGPVTVIHHYPDALRHHYMPSDMHHDLRLYAGSFRLNGEADIWEGEVRWRWGWRPRIEAFGQRAARRDNIADLLAGSSTGGMWAAHAVLDIDLANGLLPPTPSDQERPDTATPPGTESTTTAIEQEVGAQTRINRATFLVPNGWSGFDGGGVCDSSSRDVYWRGRATCIGDGWVVTIDRVRAMSGDQSFRPLRNQQGFRFTHVGELRRADGASFEAAEVFNVLERVRIGLDLALGRRVTCALPVGYVADKPVWSRWRTTLLHPYREVGHVLDETIANSQIASIVGLMLDTTSDAVALTAIKSAVGYYTAANNDVTNDLGVSLPVSGLQLMAYFHFVSGSAATYSRTRWKAATPTTADEIGLLLDEMQVARPIPAHFHSLLAARASMSPAKQSADALSTVIEMRNVVTHPTRDLPAETYDPYMWFEASALVRYWLCLSVLKEIGYRGPVAKIHQLKPRWVGQVMDPPWVPVPSP